MRAVTILLSLILTSSALAGEVVIPAIYRGDGANGSVWRTELAVANVTPSPAFPARADATLYREGLEPIAVPLLLSQYENLLIDDVVFSWFGVENGGGLVRITWDDANTRITARARIYNVTAAGQFGQAAPGLALPELQQDNFLIGVSGTRGNRTNVGISNPHATPVQAWIELLDTAGNTHGEYSVLIPARTWRQFNDIFALFPHAGPQHPAVIRVKAIENTVYAYASVVRADTGDATFITPSR